MIHPGGEMMLKNSMDVTGSSLKKSLSFVVRRDGVPMSLSVRTTLKRSEVTCEIRFALLDFFEPNNPYFAARFASPARLPHRERAGRLIHSRYGKSQVPEMFR
jgi:hypothetical protein